MWHYSANQVISPEKRQEHLCVKTETARADELTLLLMFVQTVRVKQSQGKKKKWNSEHTFSFFNQALKTRFSEASYLVVDSKWMFEFFLPDLLKF